MNKQAAVDYLKTLGVEVSVRTLQRATKDPHNPLPVAYVRGHKGDEADFSTDDLDRFAERRKSATYISHDMPSHNNGTGDTAMVRREATSLATSGAPVTPEYQKRMLKAFEALASPVKLTDKMLLSIPEAAHLSGVPVEHLRAAVHKGKLKTVGMGRGLGKVKRADLDLFVKKL